LFAHTKIVDFLDLNFYDMLRIRLFHGRGLKTTDDIVADIPLLEDLWFPF
jgi:hypothetical protein